MQPKHAEKMEGDGLIIGESKKQLARSEHLVASIFQQKMHSKDNTISTFCLWSRIDMGALYSYPRG